MLGPLLVVFLVLALLGVLPRWSHSRDREISRAEGWVSFL